MWESWKAVSRGDVEYRHSGCVNASLSDWATLGLPGVLEKSGLNEITIEKCNGKLTATIFDHFYQVEALVRVASMRTHFGSFRIPSLEQPDIWARWWAWKHLNRALGEAPGRVNQILDFQVQPKHPEFPSGRKCQDKRYHKRHMTSQRLSRTGSEVVLWVAPVRFEGQSENKEELLKKLRTIEAMEKPLAVAQKSEHVRKVVT